MNVERCNAIFNKDTERRSSTCGEIAKAAYVLNPVAVLCGERVIVTDVCGVDVRYRRL